MSQFQRAVRGSTEGKPKTAFQHYRSFLLSPAAFVTLSSGILLLLAAILFLVDQASWSERLFLLSALTGGAYILSSAVKGVLQRDFTADVLVSIAMIGSIAISRYEAAAIVAFMLMLGGFLEEFTATRAGRALRDLAGLIPVVAAIRTESGETTVPVNQVLIGDIILVKPGERIPVDGAVTAGRASVNQASITGESVPVLKQEETRFSPAL